MAADKLISRISKLDVEKVTNWIDKSINREEETQTMGTEGDKDGKQKEREVPAHTEVIDTGSIKWDSLASRGGCWSTDGSSCVRRKL